MIAHKLPQAYHRFAQANEQDLENQVAAFEDMISKGEDYLDRQGRDEVDYGNDLLDMAEFNQGYARNSLAIHGSVIEMLVENELEQGVTASLCDSMLARTFRLEDGIRVLADSLRQRKEAYWQKFTQSASYVHEDAHNTFEDAIYTLEKNGPELLLVSEPIVSAHNPDGLESRKLLFRLAKVDPEKFGSRFGLGENKVSLASSSQWSAVGEYREGFDAIEADLTGWVPATEVRHAGLQALLADAVPIWKTPASAVFDTLSVPLSQLAAGAQILDTLSAGPDAEPLIRVLQARASAGGVADTAYFRSSFELQGTPTSARIEIAADDNYYLFFNGEYIDESHAATGTLTELKSYDLAEFVKPGRNTLAVEVEDADGSGGGLSVRVEVSEMQQLTDELFEEQIRRETAAREERIKVQQKNRIYDKNRVD